MSKEPSTHRKEVHLDPSVVNALDQMAASMHPPIKVKKLMEMILEEHATGRRNNDDSEGGTPIPAANHIVAVPMGPGEEPGMLELELQRTAKRKNIVLVKLERQLATNLPSMKYDELMSSASEPTDEVRNNIYSQIRSRFGNLTTVLAGCGQAIEDMSVKVCESHVILGDHLMEYMISYEYAK